jgi:hypothetical protein
MKRTGKHELEIDLWWRQTGPDEWVALIVNRKTGRQAEARTEAELQQALESLRDGQGRSTAPERQIREEEERARPKAEGGC